MSENIVDMEYWRVAFLGRSGTHRYHSNDWNCKEHTCFNFLLREVFLLYTNWTKALSIAIALCVEASVMWSSWASIGFKIVVPMLSKLSVSWANTLGDLLVMQLWELLFPNTALFLACQQVAYVCDARLCMRITGLRVTAKEKRPFWAVQQMRSLSRGCIIGCISLYISGVQNERLSYQNTLGLSLSQKRMIVSHEV